MANPRSEGRRFSTSTRPVTWSCMMYSSDTEMLLELARLTASELRELCFETIDSKVENLKKLFIQYLLKEFMVQLQFTTV